ncbi:hypothetical protein [Flavobacterium sp.]|uniref:hypothetical protein n=1 Tax=Flavobacterium sp. TaxID=239 RepID=UPI0038FC04EB
MKEDLLGNSTVKRRKAAIEIRKNNIEGYSAILLDALKIESNKTHPETIIELIKTLGFKGDEVAKLYIKENYVDKGLFLATSCAAYVRLDRVDNSDVTSIIDFIRTNDFSKKEGVLEVLGYDKMIPSIENQEKIISLCWNFGIDRLRGLTDPRYGLAAACAGWECDKTETFLLHCLESKDEPLIYVSKNSLKKKYVKLR